LTFENTELKYSGECLLYGSCGRVEACRPTRGQTQTSKRHWAAGALVTTSPPSSATRQERSVSQSLTRSSSASSRYYLLSSYITLH